MTQSYSVTPVSQSQGFIPVWPLAASAHGKYHFMARNLPCVCTENIIVLPMPLRNRTVDTLAQPISLLQHKTSTINLLYSNKYPVHGDNITTYKNTIHTKNSHNLFTHYLSIYSTSYQGYCIYPRNTFNFLIITRAE